MIDDAGIMEELAHNKMIKRHLKVILRYVTPYIPLIELVCGVTIVGKHILSRKQVKTLTIMDNKHRSKRSLTLFFKLNKLGKK